MKTGRALFEREFIELVVTAHDTVSAAIRGRDVAPLLRKLTRVCVAYTLAELEKVAPEAVDGARLALAAVNSRRP